MQNQITKAGAGTLRPLPELETTIRAAAVLELQGALTIGVCLMEAKEQLGRGKWLPWLQKMKISSTYAERRMRLAAEIPPESPLAALNYSQAMAMMALPAGERESFAQEHDIQEKTAAEIRQLIRERDEARDNWNTYQESAIHWKREADYRAQRIEELQNAEPRTVKVTEVPDDYQALKMAAAHHQAEMEEAAQAAEEAESRAAAAEAELARMRREQGGQAADKFTAAQGAANTFLMAVQLLPYDREELGSLYNRQRYQSLVKGIREWCDEMADALEGGPLDAVGEVI